MSITTPLSLADFAISQLETSFSGQLISAAHAEYDAARAVWNGAFNRKPLLIARCLNSEDVRQAIIFAKANELIVAVRGGGHSIPGHSVCDAGLVIDLSMMKKITVDPARKTAIAEGGALWSDLDTATQEHGLATTGGTVSHTGIGGLTLGGGQGWLHNSIGFTCDNLLSVEIVTAEGSIIQASSSETTDLFWALRGGGGNFGVVTSFEYRLHPVGPEILGGMILYPMDQAKKALQFYREFSMNTPNELGMIAAFVTTPDGLPVLALVPAWLGDLEEGKKVLEPLRTFGQPLADLIAVIPYLQMQQIFNAAVPHGLHRYLKMGYMPRMSDELIDIILDQVSNKTSPYTIVLFNCIKGQATTIDPQATAFPHRASQWHFEIAAQWNNAADTSHHTQWTKNFWKLTEPFTRGAGTNFLDADDSDRIKSAYGVNYSRLKEIKKKFDPENFFRMNNNIIPAD